MSEHPVCTASHDKASILTAVKTHKARRTPLCLVSCSTSVLSSSSLPPYSSNAQWLQKHTEDPAGGKHLSLLLVWVMKAGRNLCFQTEGGAALPWRRITGRPFQLFWGVEFQFCPQTFTIILCNGICSCVLVTCCVSFAAVQYT